MPTPATVEMLWISAIEVIGDSFGHDIRVEEVTAAGYAFACERCGVRGSMTRDPSATATLGWRVAGFGDEEPCKAA